MAISVRGTDFVYFPGPKLAATSMKLALLRHNRPFVYLYRILQSQSADEMAHHGTYWTMPFEMVPESLKSGRAFCIVRDPIDRFVSAYRNRILFWRDVEQAPDLAGIPVAPPINEFVERIAEYFSNRHIRHHFAPMTEFYGHNADFFDRLFHIEEINRIPAYLGLKLKIPTEQTGGPRMSRADLSSNSIRIRTDLYDADYSAFGRFFECPRRA